MHRKPASVDRDDCEQLEFRIFEVEIANGGLGAVRECGPARFERLEGFSAVAAENGLPVELGDHGAAFQARFGKRIATRRQIETLHGNSVIPGLLVRERVENTASHLSARDFRTMEAVYRLANGALVVP